MLAMMKSDFQKIIRADADNKARATVVILALCFITSFATTYSGLIALVGGWGEVTAFKLFLTFAFTAVIQFTLIWFAKKWWETRDYMWLFPFSFCVFLSVTMALACYFDVLSLDKAHAGNVYSEKLEETLGAATASTHRYQDIARKTQELADYSSRMVRREENPGGTCDVTETGRGPRALFRENDQKKFKYYSEVFNRKSKKLSGIHKEILHNFQRYDGGKIIFLNDQVHRFNAIVTDNTDLVQLKSWLGKRVAGGGEWFDTGVLFGKTYIECPDARIKQYYGDVKSASFGKIPAIKNIANPDTPGTQVQQAFATMTNLMTLQWRRISLEEWVAFLFALGIDLVIFFLTYRRPKTASPSAGSSWVEYWRSFQEYESQFPPILKRLFGYASHKKAKINFFVPTRESDVIISILPSISNGMVKHQGTIGKWKMPFKVPAQIRKNTAECFSFEHYQLSIHSAAQWIRDWQNWEKDGDLHISKVSKAHPEKNSSLNGKSRFHTHDPMRDISAHGDAGSGASRSKAGE